jgi:hypothetical protein
MSARRIVALGAALLLAACQREPTAAEQAAADAHDIAMVEAAQDRNPPIQPLSPQPITSTELNERELTGARCAFEPRGSREPVLLAFESKAVMLIDGSPSSFAGDSAGPPGPVGTWQHYVGKALSLRLVKGGGDGVEAGSDALEWPAELTVRDEYDRIVYTRQGLLRCGD